MQATLSTTPRRDALDRARRDRAAIASVFPDRLVTSKEGAAVLNCGRTTFWRYSRSPGFPLPIRTPSGAKRWRLSELLALSPSKSA
jgi:predicted DNA-binding transcriptional regulator AlpA